MRQLFAKKTKTCMDEKYITDSRGQWCYNLSSDIPLASERPESVSADTKKACRKRTEQELARKHENQGIKDSKVIPKRARRVKSSRQAYVRSAV